MEWNNSTSIVLGGLTRVSLAGLQLQKQVCWSTCLSPLLINVCSRPAASGENLGRTCDLLDRETATRVQEDLTVDFVGYCFPSPSFLNMGDFREILKCVRVCVCVDFYCFTEWD